MEQALSFEGTGLDLDNNPAAVNPGDSPFRYNVRYGTTERSDLGGIQNTKGSTLLNLNFNGGFFIQPLGDNEVIGSCKDPERDAIIYFVWNSLNQHQIRRIFTKDRKIQVILESPTLNFKRTHKIIHANVVDNTLSWTDGWVDPNNEFNYNPPRQIDIDLAIGNYLGSPWPNGYTTIDFQTLDAIRYAPGLCPTFQYVNNLNFNDNRLYGHLFQFAYRYVYYDNSRSVLSPISKLTLPQGEDIEGNYELTTENQLNVTVETGHYTVTRIELIAREGTSYKVVDYVDKYSDSGTVIVPSDSTYTFEFFNTKFVQELTLEEALRPFDYVPQTADTQEVISSKQGARRIFGSYTEGYENTTNFDLQAEVKIEKIDPTDLNYKNLTFKRKGTYQLGVVYADKAGRKSFVQTNPSARLSIPWWRSTELIGQYYDPNDEWILSTHQKPYIEWQLNAQAPEWADTYQIVCTKDISNQQKLLTFYNFGAAVGDKELGRYKVGANSIYIPPQIGYDYQKGDRIRIIAQFDNTENPNVVGPNSSVGFSQTFFDDLNVLGVVNPLITTTPQNPYQVNLMQSYNNPNQIILDSQIRSFNSQTQRVIIDDEFELDHRILYLFEIYNPETQINEENVSYYEIGETYPITSNQISNSGVINGVDTFVGNNKYEFGPSPFIFSTHKWTHRRKNEPDVPQFFYVPGVDLGTIFNPPFVFLSAFTAFRPYGVPSTEQQFGTYTIDNSPLIGANTSSNRASMNGTYPTWSARWNGTETKITALPERNNFWDTLINPFTQETLFEGALGADATLTVRSPNVKFEIFNIITESKSYSVHYESTVDQTGRPYVINREAIRRKYFANLIFGGPVYDNTLINFFSRYDFKDVERLNERYNQITRIQEVGFMLKVRQRNKSTSIYVGRSELTNTDGSTNLAAISDVLGTVNPSDEVWGGTHPGADTKAIRDTYFFDAINGVVVRDATNGLVAISGNKQSANDPYRMTAFFRDLGEFVRQNEENIEVISAWDENTNSYFFTLRVIKDMERPPFVAKYRIEEAWNNGFTLSFHETTNRWQSFHPFIPEWYGQIGNTFVAFRNGEAWMHYTNDIRNSYFGGTYPIITEQICNQYTNNIKVFDNIDVYSNVKWKATDAPSGEDIYIIPNAQFPTGMKSKLSEQNFVGKEGKWHASFLNDMNSPGYSNELLALMNGRKLRGEALRIRLRNEDNDKDVFLRQVIFHFTPSEISG